MANILNMPPELMEHTVHDLELTDVRNLRLSCRGFCEKLSHRFKTFFVHQTTNLSQESLRTLVEISQNVDLASCVKSITILATIYSTTRLDEIIETGTRRVVEQTGMITCTTTVNCTQEELEVAKADRDLILQKIADQEHVQTAGIDISMLGIIFHNLKPVPLALSFEVNIQKDIDVRRPARFCSDLPQLWRCTSHTFIAAMAAVAQSGLALSSLHVYGGEWGGALSLHDLHYALPQLKAEGITTALTSLQKLYICVAPYVTEEDSIEEDNVQQVNAEEDSPNDEHHMALAELLSLASSVEELDVHGFNVRGQSVIYLDSIAQKAPLHRLKKCTLRGAYIEEDSILQILRNNPQLNSLYLKRIVLAGGSWKNVFTYLAPVCTSAGSSNPASHEIDSSLTVSCKLDVVVLDSLYSSPTGRLLRFLQEDGNSNASLGFLHHRIEIHSTDLCRGIQYEILQGRPKGSAALYRWRNENKIEFGPF
ncbi:hypothetical protein BDQ12DRAFT_737601 [Crucibulum laeve]|uniref:F-box domain-containing protein n=1 Tax=Crucibulum laeve TaxID=68775 RepID=A0A5C3LRJ9_9AGAR|nr:hypothetical protein BDQ12DRAFT_737601 [Crucibulum laeve]